MNGHPSVRTKLHRPSSVFGSSRRVQTSVGDSRSTDVHSDLNVRTLTYINPHPSEPSKNSVLSGTKQPGPETEETRLTSEEKPSHRHCSGPPTQVVRGRRDTTVWTGNGRVRCPSTGPRPGGPGLPRHEVPPAPERPPSRLPTRVASDVHPPWTAGTTGGEDRVDPDKATLTSTHRHSSPCRGSVRTGRQVGHDSGFHHLGHVLNFSTVTLVQYLEGRRRRRRPGRRPSGLTPRNTETRGWRIKGLP